MELLPFEDIKHEDTQMLIHISYMQTTSNQISSIIIKK